MVNKAGPKKAQYDKSYNSRPDQVKKREMRNQARAEMERKGLVHKGDGKDVDHKHMLKDGGSNHPSNLRVVSEHVNRGWKRGKK